MAKKKVEPKVDESAPIAEPGLEIGPEKVQAKVGDSKCNHHVDIAKHPKFSKFNSHGGKIEND